jgi:hypothetical protein
MDIISDSFSVILPEWLLAMMVASTWRFVIYFWGLYKKHHVSPPVTVLERVYHIDGFITDIYVAITNVSILGTMC